MRRGWSSARALGAATTLWLWAALACAPPPLAASAVTPSAAPATEPAPAPPDDDDVPAFELPTRRAETPAAVPLPELPATLIAPADLTLELETTSTRRGRTLRRRESVARSAHRIHIRGIDDDVEWFFVQNPVDPRRVSGSRIDHAKHVVIDYDEAELRMGGIARGWADVASFGVGVERLARLAPTGRREQRWGFEFTELGVPAGSPPGAHVWWSEAAALPLRVEGSSSTLEVRSLRPGVAPERLLDPRLRYPTYDSIDIADYREKHHDHVEAKGKAGPGAASDAAQR